jgi:hypothetical protein
MAGARKRYSIAALGAAAVVVLALANLDAASSTPDHLRGAVQGGFSGLAHVAANRVPLSYNRMIEQWWLLVPGFFVVTIGLGAAWFARTRAERATVLALLAALLASLLVNDSPGPVMIGGLTALFAVEAGTLHRLLTVPIVRRIAAPTPVLEQ